MALFQYNLGSEIPFSSIDYGFISETMMEMINRKRLEETDAEEFRIFPPK